MAAPIELSIQVRFNDMDLAGHAHNGIYLSWFELARMRFLDQFIPLDHDWTTFGLILARNEVDYRIPVRLRDQVSVTCFCTRIGGSSFELTYVLQVVQGKAKVIAAEGKSIMVCYDYKKGKSRALPKEWRSALDNELVEGA